jgi:hypothetical protein
VKKIPCVAEAHGEKSPWYISFLLLKNHIWTKPTKKKQKNTIGRNSSTVQSFVIVDLHWTKPTMKITLGQNPFTRERKRGNVKREKSW